MRYISGFVRRQWKMLLLGAILGLYALCWIHFLTWEGGATY